jgi:cytochrome c oxidase subunit 4
MSDHSSSDANHDAHHGPGHIVSPPILIATGLALLVLTVVTVAVAGIDLGEANIYVALAIAVLKGSLVALFFMHLRWDRPFNQIVFVSSLCFVGLFIAFAMTDTAEYREFLLDGDAPAVEKALADAEAEAANAEPGG